MPEKKDYKRTPQVVATGKPIQRKDTIYTPEEIEAMGAEYQQLCVSFGKGYNPLKKCKFCQLRVLCSVAQARKAKSRVKKFTKKQYHADYYFDEYLATIRDKKKMGAYKSYIGNAIYNHGKPVTFSQVAAIISDPDHEMYYVDYMKTHDPLFPYVICCALASFEELEVDIKNETITPKLATTHAENK